MGYYIDIISRNIVCIYVDNIFDIQFSVYSSEENHYDIWLASNILKSLMSMDHSNASSYITDPRYDIQYFIIEDSSHSVITEQDNITSKSVEKYICARGFNREEILVKKDNLSFNQSEWYTLQNILNKIPSESLVN